MRGHLNVPKRRWDRVLEIILRNNVVRDKICHGIYLNKLKKLVKNEELAEVVCDICYILSGGCVLQ